MATTTKTTFIVTETSDKEEFLRWFPEIHKNIFNHFRLHELQMTVKDSEGNYRVFSYSPEAK